LQSGNVYPIAAQCVTRLCEAGVNTTLYSTKTNCDKFAPKAAFTTTIFATLECGVVVR